MEREEEEKEGIVSVFTTLNLIAIVLAGVFIFKEDLSVLNKIGIILGVLSLLLIELG